MPRATAGKLLTFFPAWGGSFLGMILSPFLSPLYYPLSIRFGRTVFVVGFLRTVKVLEYECGFQLHN